MELFLHLPVCCHGVQRGNLIFTLSKSAKLYWGLGHTALKTIYTGGILPLLLYGAPVWENAIYKASHKAKLTQVQRLINIKVAKAYRTVSRTDPYSHKNSETSQLYHLTKSNRGDEVLFDQTIGVKDWQHPAETITILMDSNESTSSTQIFIDGSKSDQGVGAGIAIFRLGKHFKNIQYRLNK